MTETHGIAIRDINNLSFRSFEWNDKIEKLGPHGVLINEKDKTLVAWILDMQEVGFSITL
jgi:hypothetical protein